MVGEDMMPGLRIIWILILGGGKMFMVRMKMKKRTMKMMMGAWGAVLSVLLRCADDSSRGPIMILKVTMSKMRRRKMLAHH